MLFLSLAFFQQSTIAGTSVACRFLSPGNYVIKFSIPDTLHAFVRDVKDILNDIICIHMGESMADSSSVDIASCYIYDYFHVLTGIFFDINYGFGGFFHRNGSGENFEHIYFA